MKIKVNTILDFSVGALTHNMLAPPAIPAPVPTPSIEMIATMMWTLGFLTNQNKFSNGARPVNHRGQWVMLDGHDCGMMIPDITLPPAPNIAYPLFWPFSSRKPTFAASTVKMNGTAVGCAQLYGIPPLPMMTCGDPLGAPTANSMINFLNGVKVGITWRDLVAGVINIVGSMLTDYIFSKIPFDKVFGGRGLGVLAQNFLGTALGNALKGLSPVSILAGFGSSALTGNATFSVGLGLPFLGGQVSYTPHPSEGSPSVVAQGNIPFTRMDTTGSGQAFGTPVTL
jgi:hypothetical protein